MNENAVPGNRSALFRSWPRAGKNSRTRAGGRCAICAFRSPTAAISAAPIACRRRCSARTSSSSSAAQLLSFEEIQRLVRIFRDHGVEKIRITGGEPLVRRKLERLIEMLAYWDAWI